MKYPLLILKKGDDNIYALKKMFGIVSVGGENFYKNITVIDSDGNRFEVVKVEIEGVAKFKYCLMYFQKMLNLNITFKQDIGRIELNELKEMLKDKISKKPKKWLNIGTVNRIHDFIDKKENFKELISMFF